MTRSKSSSESEQDKVLSPSPNEHGSRNAGEEEVATPPEVQQSEATKSRSRSRSKSADDVRSPPSSGDEDEGAKKKDDDRSKESKSEKRRARSRSRSKSRSRSHDRRRRERSSDGRRERSREGRRDRSREDRQRRRDDRRDRDRRDRKRSRTRSRSNERRGDRSPATRRRRERSPEKRDEQKKAEEKKEEEKKEKKEPMDLLRTRTGGAYIPPAKLRMMQDQIQDKQGEQYQRMNWERLKKKIHGLVNKVNTGNLVQIVRSLLQENVIRGKGLLVRSIMQAQAFSPVFSHVYAAFVAVINSKFPHIGELLLRRLIVQFKRSFRRNDKGTTVTVSKFIAHLINQKVAHEVLALEIMILMLETPTDDSVEVSIAFLKECGAKLAEVSPRALDTIFTRLRGILQDGDATNLDKRVQYMIEVVMAIRKDKFKAYPAVLEELDLIDEDDQITHTLSLEDAINPENELNVFKMDPEFEKNEKQYEEIRAEIIGDADDSDEEGSDDEEGSGGEVDEEGAAAPSGTTEIIDNTEQNLVAFRREVYLTIQSSLDFQEAAHKLLKMKVPTEMETELCNMLVDCCCQQRTYERFYGLLCERFCRLRKEYQETFEKIACDTYATIHRFDITKLRNMARLISHLLFTDAISWTIFTDVKLTENDTTSSGRIYLKYIFQELCESMGLAKLYERISDPTLQTAFAGLFPRDNPQNTRFAINFFTLTGLGGLTLDLRKFLEKGMKKKKENSLDESPTSSSSSSESSSDSSDSDDDDDSDSDDSDSSSSSSSSSSSADSTDAKKRAALKKKLKRARLDKENKKKDKADKRIKEEPPSPDSPPKRERQEKMESPQVDVIDQDLRLEQGKSGNRLVGEIVPEMKISRRHEQTVRSRARIVTETRDGEVVVLQGIGRPKTKVTGGHVHQKHDYMRFE
ncbi:unnamed protein product [Cylicocyclus nassatus]|uniref:Lethal protein 858 n=1 Tax=Cylicocyclus nassatus TaxID=53992 RepID=A0AA36H7Y0_CYLNA|nr:unnamed protein product [Cylicocyclus nassatus]